MVNVWSVSKVLEDPGILTEEESKKAMPFCLSGCSQLSKRLKVSVAELIRINDTDLWDIKSEDDIVPLAYNENENMDSLGNIIRFITISILSYLIKRNKKMLLKKESNMKS